MQKLLKMFGIGAVASILSMLIAHPAKAEMYCSYQMAGQRQRTVDRSCQILPNGGGMTVTWGDGVETIISIDWDSVTSTPRSDGDGANSSGYAYIRSGSGDSRELGPRYHFNRVLDSSRNHYHFWRESDDGGTHHVYTYVNQ
jgi:hypothetical protein